MRGSSIINKLCFQQIVAQQPSNGCHCTALHGVGHKSFVHKQTVAAVSLSAPVQVEVHGGALLGRLVHKFSLQVFARTSDPVSN